MHTIKITTSQNIELDYELASLGERIVGRIIDLLIVVAYIVILVLIFMAGSFTLIENYPWLMVPLALPVVFYDLVSELLMNGQSVGKRVMNIKVISINGAQPSLGQYLIRWLFRLVDFSLTSGLCALITVAVSIKKQRLGDMVAGTTLIKTIPRTTFHETLYTPVQQDDYQVSFPEVTTLSDSDMQLIKEVILTATKTGNGYLAYEASVKIKQILNVSSNLEPLPFLQTVLADFNYLSSASTEG